MSPPFPPTALRRRHAQTVRDRCSSFKIDYVIVIKNFLNPEGHQNPITDSKVTAILLKSGFYLLVELQRGRICACSLRSRLVMKYYNTEPIAEDIVSVLWWEEGYMEKYSLNAREIPREEPKGFSRAQAIFHSISWLESQYRHSQFLKCILPVLSFLVGQYRKSWFSILVWQLQLYFPVLPSRWSNTGHSQLLKRIILKFNSSSIALPTMCIS